MKKRFDEEGREPLSFSDLCAILGQQKVKIALFAVIFGALASLLALIKPIRYQAEGTFREKGVKQSPLSTSSSLIHLLSAGGGGGSGDSEAASLMLSYSILQKVIEELHLQADLKPSEEAEPLSLLVKRNFQLAMAAIKNQIKPVLKDAVPSLKIQALDYPGEMPLYLTLKLKEGGQFDLFDDLEGGVWVGQGKMGAPFHLGLLRMTLVPQGGSLLPQTFHLRVDSLTNKVKEIKAHLKIEPTKLDKSLLKITYENRDRQLASRLINALMEKFQAYLIHYHADMATKQLDYLSQRRDDLSANLTKLMVKHADFLANDLYGSGFIESNKEMDFLARSQHEYKRKLLDNELEIKRLSHIKPGDFTHYDRYSSNDGDSVVINNIFSEIRALKQQRDALEIEMQKKALFQGENLQLYFDKQVEELKDVQAYLKELRLIQEQFDLGLFPSQDFSLMKDPRFLLKGWFDRLRSSQESAHLLEGEMKESLKFYLNHLERLFGVHERILQERLTHQRNPAGEYQGINLDDATELYRDFSKQLIQIESNIRQNTFFIHQIEDPNFEITSLSAGLTDPISSDIIRKSSQLIFNLRDQNNQSIREQMRIREELHLERTFLTLHLQQMVQLMELNKELIDEKIFALQNVGLELIHQKISLLEKNLQDYLEARLEHLKQERFLIKRHLKEIQTEMTKLPQKWVSEQLLTQEVTTNHLIVEEIAKLVETKNISHNLEVLESAPVDFAIAPLYPKTPPFFILGIIGLFFGAFLGSTLALLSSSMEKLKARELREKKKAQTEEKEPLHSPS